jgi:hypothetical protein
MASSTFYYFDCFTADLGNLKHSLNNVDTLMVLLTDTVPNAGDTVVDTTQTTCIVKGTSNAAEIAAASGYTKGGFTLTSVAWSQVSGVAKLTAAIATWTAGAAIGPFKYAVLYNNSRGTTSTRPVIGWFSYGGEVTLGVGEVFTLGNSNDGSAWTSTYPILQLAHA